jgi:hypothetical protein
MCLRIFLSSWDLFFNIFYDKIFCRRIFKEGFVNEKVILCVVELFVVGYVAGVGKCGGDLL